MWDAGFGMGHVWCGIGMWGARCGMRGAGWYRYGRDAGKAWTRGLVCFNGNINLVWFKLLF